MKLVQLKNNKNEKIAPINPNYENQFKKYSCFELLASGRVYDTENGVDIPTGHTGMYIVFTFGWAAMANKTGIRVCENITGAHFNVREILGGEYTGEVTFNNNIINIKPYNSGGCFYKVIMVFTY